MRTDAKNRGGIAWPVAAAVAAVALSGGTAAGQLAPWREARLGAAPARFGFTIEEVYFKRPQTYKPNAATIVKALIALKVTIRGEGFRQADTGPLVWLNRTPANYSKVSPDGTVIEAYFYRPLAHFEEAAKRLARWEVSYSPHDGDTIFRLGLPRGPAPLVRRLGVAEYKHAQELGRTYGIEVPDRP